MKDDETNLNKEGVFQRWNVFVRYDLQSNVTVLFWFGFYRKYGEEIEGFQNDWIRAYMSFKTLPIPTGCKLKF